MTKALLQQALDALEWASDLNQIAVDSFTIHDAITALRAELAQPAPEPVAWAMLRADGLVLDVICPDERDSYQGAYTVPLYAATQPAPAVPLTDEQIALAIFEARVGHSPFKRDGSTSFRIARAAIAKFCEVNGIVAPGSADHG